MASHGADGVGEVVDAAYVAFEGGVCLHVEAFARTWLQVVVAAEPGDGFDGFVERVAQEP